MMRPRNKKEDDDEGDEDPFKERLVERQVMRVLEGGLIEVDAEGLPYKDLNLIIKQNSWADKKKFKIFNVCGQRYIGTGVDRPVDIEIYGTPGNDLGAFMDGPTIRVFGNAQDGLGNTMNEGTIIVHGHAGDIAGYGMRGGQVFIKEDVGYRVGIHMKEYKGKAPLLVIGGTAQDFLGEYMAGGRLIVLGLTLKEGTFHKANFIGTGMHAGVIYIRGDVADHQIGEGVAKVPLDDKDLVFLDTVVGSFCTYFGGSKEEVLKAGFIKLKARSTRPYKKIYAY
jgi:glutamate synthase domain-containing protein 3